jgi:hypothetical protein
MPQLANATGHPPVLHHGLAVISRLKTDLFGTLKTDLFGTLKTDLFGTLETDLFGTLETDLFGILKTRRGQGKLTLQLHPPVLHHGLAVVRIPLEFPLLRAELKLGQLLGRDCKKKAGIKCFIPARLAALHGLQEETSTKNKIGTNHGMSLFANNTLLLTSLINFVACEQDTTTNKGSLCTSESRLEGLLICIFFLTSACAFLASSNAFCALPSAARCFSAAALACLARRSACTLKNRRTDKMNSCLWPAPPGASQRLPWPAWRGVLPAQQNRRTEGAESLVQRRPVLLGGRSGLLGEALGLRGE